MRQTLVFNVLVVSLLLACAAGIYTIPKFNYGALVARQTELEAKQETLRTRYESLDRMRLFSDEEAAKRGALLDSVFSLPEVLARLQKGLSEVSEEVGSFHFFLGDLETRLERLEKGKKGEQPEAPQEDIFDRYRKSYTEKLDLPQDIRQKANDFSAQRLAEDDFDTFLQEAIRNKCLTYEDGGAVPPEEYERLVKAFSIFKANMDLINRTAYMKVLELAADADRQGSFLERQLHGDTQNSVGVPSMSEPGIVHQQRLRELGTSRTYYLPYSAYPELAEYEAMRENARDHLIRDVATIHGSSSKHSTGGGAAER